MTRSQEFAGKTARYLAVGLAAAASSWAAYSAVAWVRYGKQKRLAGPVHDDPLLDRFMNEYEVVEHHRVRIEAPAETAWASALNLNLRRSRIVRAIFRGRELIMGSEPAESASPASLLNWAQALGWGVLEEVPGHEVILGAVTRPWEANVVFRTIHADHFTDFHEPGYAKIVWNLRVDPLTANQSIARTETRVSTTDPGSRAKFRRYWAALSPGMILIRKVALALVKSDAERVCQRDVIQAAALH